MIYIATILVGRNSFIKIELENHDDPESTVKQDADAVASKLGGLFLYLEEKPCV